MTQFKNKNNKITIKRQQKLIKSYTKFSVIIIKQAIFQRRHINLHNFAQLRWALGGMKTIISTEKY